ncbi:EAL domain-containing protein [Protaetiibacter sp. SSC-01]|uniref:EAL domain-containing protein n=1 Tax=Protaetiibacter sp. SSC-01 TaxID=2759943 RepID=UPI001656F0BA|nr:EAL domain-containing protein [Protaetiibacter sp. SSC-01]QNO36356.1 EAL domain-containing protein [Protaetiibacter sp. SSC-01]
MHEGIGEKRDDELAGRLRRALETGQLTAHFQPQYDLKTGRVVALEALCRWNDPDHGLLLPDRFIHLAEQHHLIADIGRVMLEESGRQLADWHRRGVAVGVALNVSPSELDAEFSRRILRRVEELGLPRGAVTVEITESPAMRETDDETRWLQELIDGGVGVSIDDFGAGHTSLELLRHVPFTELKIDRSLLADRSAGVDELVAQAREIAHERGAHIVAEGIENEVDLARALSWGCDRGQGFYFSPPLPADALEPVLATVVS